MSAYSGTPTVNRSYDLGDRFQKRVALVKDLTLTISSQGGATNTIGYAALGYQDGGIHKVTVISYIDGSEVRRGILAWTDGDNIYLGDPQTATDADRCDATDMTGTLRIEVVGDQA
jgi:hypothetical protein